MALVIHPHFHRRRTGVTTHVETVVPALNAYVKTRLIAQGYRLAPNLETITKAELSQSLKQGIPVVWHAHRNHEMLWGLQLKIRYPTLVFIHPVSVFRRSCYEPGRRGSQRGSPRHFKRALRLFITALMVFAFPTAEMPVGFGRRVFLGYTTIGIVGRVRPKRADVLVNAALELRKDYPELKLVFIGACDTKHESWLTPQTKSTGSPGGSAAIELHLGTRHRHHCSALFSWGFSCMVLEAMSSGRTVAVSDISDFHQLIDHGNNGYLFDAGDHSSATFSSIC